MNDTLVTIKAAVCAAITAMSAFWGWKGWVAVIWVIAMALDFATGTAAAMREGNWSSKIAREGIWHKAGMLAVVLVAMLADLGMGVLCANLELGFAWPGIVLPLVLAWYIITELGSILENSVAMGAPVPGWLTKLLKASLSAVNKAAGENNEE